MYAQVARNIICEFTGQEPETISEISGFGCVNHIFDVQYPHQAYIVRLNREARRYKEFLKEKWCIQTMKKLGVPTADVFILGKMHDYNYMIMEKIKGINGTLSDSSQKPGIWEKMGRYAATYHRVREIVLPEAGQLEFHRNWREQLNYNLMQLNPKDPTLKEKVFTSSEHKEVKQILESLKKEKFTYGLIHKDLSLRNVLIDQDYVCLLDWGMAEISIVPHLEIGAVITEGEASEVEIEALITGLGINKETYKYMEIQIRKINLLDRLDKFRWAYGRNIDNESYIQKLRLAFDNVL